MSTVVLSPKQKIALSQSDARINIFQGPVRAGKTFVSLLAWIDFCYNGPKGPVLVTGRSLSSLKRNFIMPMMELMGSLFQYSEGKREALLGDRIMYIIGANDERATGKIQGATFAGCWADEATLLPESFFKMMLSRLSIDGARLYATTNPDSPLHYLKTDFIDNSNLDLKSFQFTIDDNPSLTDKYKDNLKKEYQGLWYRRYILGEWCLAEGSVYDFFDDKVHVVKQPPTWAREYYLSIDYGVNNAFGALLIAYNHDNHPALWVEKEYYYDSKVIGRQQTNSEFLRDLQKRFYELYPITLTYVDPSALSFITELKRAGIRAVQADNDVLPGIQTVSNLLSQGDLVICQDCKQLTKEFYSYVWDDKSVKLGQDKPIKQSDHLLDSLRYYCYTKWGKGQELKPRPNKPGSFKDPFSGPGWRAI